MKTSNNPPFLFTHKSKKTLIDGRFTMQKEICVFYVENGTLTLFANYKKHPLKKGDLVFLNSFVPFSFLDADKDAELYCFSFHPELIFSYGTNKISDKDFLLLSITKKGAADIFPCAKENELHTFFKDTLAITEKKSYGYEYLMHARILFLYLYLLKKWNLPEFSQKSLSGKNTETIRNVLEYTEENYTTVTPAELSERFSFQHYTFSRNFKLLTGCSFSKYIEQTKIEHAKFLLATTEKSITDIAFSVGYEDSSYFAKCFLDAETISPTKFRALHQTVLKGEVQ